MDAADIIRDGTRADEHAIAGVTVAAFGPLRLPPQLERSTALALTQPVTVRTQMLIRRPASEVFRAFVDPAYTTRFWFTRSSGPLAAGAQVRWEWEMYGAGTGVQVKALEQDRRLLIEWDDPPCPVEWRFEPRGDGATLVSIEAGGLRGSDEEVLAKALDSKGGFTIVLAGCKALLEQGVSLNLIADQYPDDLVRAGG